MRPERVRWVPRLGGGGGRRRQLRLGREAREPAASAVLVEFVGYVPTKSTIVEFAPVNSGGQRNSSVIFSAGVIQSRVMRGRPLSSAAIASRSAWLWTARSLPLGRYWRSRPLVFSLDPRCHG